MNYSDYRLTLDIHSVRSNTIVKVKRGTNTKRLCITFTENGKVYEIANGCTAVFKGKKPDGYSLYNDCTIEDNAILYVMGNNTTSAVGIVESEVSLISSEGEVITSPTFSILVEDTPVHDDDVFDSSDEATALVELVAETTDLINGVNEQLANGSFIGPKGERGPKGEKGDKGDKGDPGEVEGAVLYTEQTLTEEQKAQARANIGAGTGEGGSAEGAVLYTPQALSEAEKRQARYNIGVTESGVADDGMTEKMDMLVVEVKSKNLLNPNDPDFLIGYKLGTDGVPVVANSYVTAGFVPVTAGQTIYFSYLGNALSARVAEYDEDKNTVSVGSTNTTVYTVPEGVAFIRCHFQKVYNTAVQFELDKMTAYEPYFAPYLERVTAENRPTNVMPKEVLQGILVYQGKIATGTGFATTLIEIPDGAKKIYAGNTTAFTWTRVQFFDAEQVFIAGSATTCAIGAGGSYSLLDGAKYIQLSTTVEWSDDYSNTVLTFARVESNMAEMGYAEIPVNPVPQDAVRVWGNLARPSAFIKSVAHRCLSGMGTPECSLPAMKAAKRNGYDYVEADIQMTADRIPVMLHDLAINEQARNPNGTEIAGTVRLCDITYEQAMQYDYGISAGEEYAGLGLLTFEQFIGYCKDLGLRPYIEFKTDAGELAPTEAEVQAMVQTVKAYGMAEHSTWISTSLIYLGYIATTDPTARLGWLTAATTLTESNLNALLALKTDKNEVFADSSAHDSNSVALCKSKGVPLEVWTVDGDDKITALDPYISGVTSDYTHAGFARYKAIMQ